jgi:transposase
MGGRRATWHRGGRGQGARGHARLRALLPKRWGVDRSFAWVARFRRLARDFERLPEVLAGLHVMAFVCLLLHQFIQLYSNA